MGIHVHEFMSLDGVIDAPVWSFDYGFDDGHGRGPRRGHRRQPRRSCSAASTYEMFEPAWSKRTLRDDPGAPFFNDTTKHVVSVHVRPARAGGARQIIGPETIQPPLASFKPRRVR